MNLIVAQFICLILLGSVSAAGADVRLPAIIADGMTLQQGTGAKLFGTADEGEQVKVSFQGQTVSTTARDGRWQLWFENLKPGGPFTLSIEAKNRIDLRDVYVGEVWLCSGQSNMVWPVMRNTGASAEIAASDHPSIRIFTVPKNTADQASRDVGKGSDKTGKWLGASPKTIAPFSAVCYFFGRELHKALNVPVGLVSASAGGTSAEAWTPDEILKSDPALQSIRNEYVTFLDRTEKIRETARFRLDTPEMPMRRAVPRYEPSSLYEGMIAPLVPFALKGVVWYQGESNVMRASQYLTLFTALIRSWRSAWDAGDMPFLFVQLSSVAYSGREQQRRVPVRKAWPELREAQLQTFRTVPQTAMVVSFDLGDGTLHPPDKQPFGQRLAIAARAVAYGEKLVYSGPLYESMTVAGNKAILRFKHTGSGLVARGDELKGFAVAGSDRRFHAARAVIDADCVFVSSLSVDSPAAVRYGWSGAPEGNLYNGEGLPASPFRTDDWHTE